MAGEVAMPANVSLKSSSQPAPSESMRLPEIFREMVRDALEAEGVGALDDYEALKYLINGSIGYKESYHKLLPEVAQLNAVMQSGRTRVH
jgi:hypothetical protein